MHLICQNQLIPLTDIFLTSQTIKDIISDCEIEDYITIPDQYFQALTIKPKNIEDKISLLDLYDFLCVDILYLTDLAKEIGHELERQQLFLDNLTPELLSIIMTSSPSLYFSDLYPDVYITRELKNDLDQNKFKYVSVWYHEYHHLTYDLKDYIRFGNLEMVEFFRSELTHNHLLLACQYPHVNMITYLQQGFPLSNEALFIAAEYRNVNVLEYFYQQNMDLTVNDNQILLTACRLGHLDVVEFLAQHNVDVTIESAMIETIKSRHLEVFKYIHEQGMDIHPLYSKALGYVFAYTNFDNDLIGQYILNNNEVVSALDFQTILIKAHNIRINVV